MQVSSEWGVGFPDIKYADMAGLAVEDERTEIVNAFERCWTVDSFFGEICDIVKLSLSGGSFVKWEDSVVFSKKHVICIDVNFRVD